MFLLYCYISPTGSAQTGKDTNVISLATVHLGPALPLQISPILLSPGPKIHFFASQFSNSLSHKHNINMIIFK